MRLLKDVVMLPMTLWIACRISDNEALNHMVFVSQAIRKEHKNCCYRLILKLMRRKHKRMYDKTGSRN